MSKSPGGTVIYTRTGCPYCTKIKEVYNMNGWTFTEYQLNVQYTRAQFKQEFGPNATFPQVVINGQKMGGCTETVKYLRESKLL
ncbi:NrdC [Cyanophage P-RSM6]|uniref:NrdC n=1 Tax=Cyanophage P-RSM6 TaxID=929832 RepID=UPI0002C18900|nr:NrdC [Cyanophage P-RSM6]AGH56810.1 NrdC [Cyanophage P-RSM6]|tara:strand:- start:675 stop:926 length:252 start_codon:yes stop_codon:yes gene_type:complete